jgi:hypothetical protein
MHRRPRPRAVVEVEVEVEAEVGVAAVERAAPAARVREVPAADAAVQVVRRCGAWS